MIRLVLYFIYFISGCCSSFAQLLPRTHSLVFANGGRLSGSEVPVVRQNNEASSLISVALSVPINRQMNYKAEITSIERFNDSGVAFISRSNHWLIYQSCEFNFGDRKNPAIKSSISLSAFNYRDTKYLKPVSQHWEAGGILIFKNKTSVQMKLEHRKDRITESFSLGELPVHSEKVTFKGIAIRFNARTGKRTFPFIETRFGYYYEQAGFYAIRLGEKIKFSPRLTGYMDCEFSQVRGEVHVQGILTRLKMDYQINKVFSAGFYLLNNSYDRFNGFLLYTGLTKNHHIIRLEYREKRNQFHFTESAHPFFASHVLIQYRYVIPYTGSKNLK